MADGTNKIDRAIDCSRKRTSDACFNSRSLNSSQEEIADELFNTLQATDAEPSCDEDEELTLDYRSDDEADEAGECDEESEHDTNYDGNEFDRFALDPFSLSYIKEVLDYYPGHRKRYQLRWRILTKTQRKRTVNDRERKNTDP